MSSWTSRLTGGFWVGITVLPLAVITLYVFAQLQSVNKVEQVQQRWAATWGGPDDIARRFPVRAATASALRIELLGAELGIELSTPGRPDRIVPSTEAVERHRALRPRCAGRGSGP